MAAKAPRLYAFWQNCCCVRIAADLQKNFCDRDTVHENNLYASQYTFSTVSTNLRGLNEIIRQCL